MTAAESRPYFVPSPGAVAAEVAMVSPRSAFADVRENWVPGESVIVRGSATLADRFWFETAIPAGEHVWLVALVSCAAAKARWREQVRFEWRNGGWTADFELSVDGSEIAVELTLDVWVVGNGRTGSLDPGIAVHEGARLWRLPEVVSIPLDRRDEGFPTSAVSFEWTNRRAVPWSVETTEECEPESSISSAIRLYVNSDLQESASILDGTASTDAYVAIGADIHLAVFHRLGKAAQTTSGLRAAADGNIQSLAALGFTLAATVGLPIEECCRLAREDPLLLMMRSRESVIAGESARTS